MAQSPDPMGGIIGDIVLSVIAPNGIALAEQLGRMQGEACIAARDADPKIREIDSRVQKISREWQPSGFYTLDDVNRIVFEVSIEAQLAMMRILAAPRTTGDAETVIKQWSSKLITRLNESKQFLSTVIAARTAGATVIQAEGLKRWVVLTLQDISAAEGVTFLMYCNYTILDDLNKFLQKLWNVLVDIKNAIVSIATTVWKIPDTVGSMLTVLKWGALAGAGLLIFSMVNRYRESRPEGR